MSEEAPAMNPDEQDALKVVIVDQSHDAMTEARDLADARLDKELGEGGRFKKFVNGIWKGNIAKDFYRQKYIHQSLDTIQDANNVLVDSPADRRTRALEATIARFQGEEEELIHTEAGERREVQNDDDALVVGIKQLVRDYASGHLNATTLQEERTRLLNDYRAQLGPDEAKKGLVTTDNLLQIAQAVAGAVEHGESLDNAVSRMQVITGEARNGVRTEANYNAVDKVIDKLAKNKITSLVTPGTLAVGVAAAASIARMGSHSVVGAVTKTLVPGAAAGLWAGLRENKRVKDERAQHAREMAMGGQFQEGDKRRVEMEKTRYESIAAIDLISHLQSVGDDERIRDGGEEALQAALDALAAVQARVQLSDSKDIDLITFSGKAEVGEERLMLDLARAETRQAVESNMTDDVRTALGLSDERTLKHVIQERAGLISEALTGEMTAKDEAFTKLKRRRVATAAAVGVATGIVGGLVVQEAVAAFDPTRFGLIDAIRGETPTTLGDGSVHQTILEGAFRGGETTIHTDASSEYTNYDTAPHGSMEVSSDHSLITNEDGTLDLKDANGNVTVEGLKVDENGSLDQASLDKLHGAGMVVEDKSFDKDITTTTTQTVSTEQYLQNHIDESTKVTRDFWYGNDTPNVYDENELRVYRGGGVEHPGIVDGGYQYTVAGMQEDGSWQGGESVDWSQAAENGNLFVAVSGTLDSQGNPFMIPIGPDGSVNIPADSPAGQFFANENNSVAFNGAYMEIVQTSGVDTDGTVHIRPLATLVGDTSVHEVNDTVTTVTPEHHAEYAITTNGYDTVENNFTEMAPITPIASRRSMEALRTNEAGTGSTGETAGVPPEASAYGYEAQLNPEKMRRWEEERSPRLRDNPDAELQTGEELDTYVEQLRRSRGDEYINEIEARIDQSEALKAINKESRAIVVMPVGAAQESENIYKALSVYAQQDQDAKEKTTVLLNVNWIDDAMNDPEKKAKIEKTLSEIERAKADFPDLNIADFTKEWSRDWVRDVRKGAMYGEVIKTLYDTAALAVHRAMKEGRATPEQDLLMITNDADQLGMNRHYLKHYIEAEEKYKDSDAFIGTIRWGVDAAKDFPGYHVSQLFMQSMNIAATRTTGHTLAPATIGPNSAFRMSMYAAIGGCEDRNDMGVGADSELGRKVLAARGRLPRVGQDAYGTTGVRYFSGSTTGPGHHERVIRQVVGSDVDSAPGRLLDTGYRMDQFIPHSWNQFDNGSTRDDNSGSPDLLKKEDVKNDFAPIQRRVERQITDFINQWYPDASVASFTLSMLFPDVPELGNNAQAWTLKKANNGVFTFAFTADGARRFRNSLLRNPKGRFDPLANRLHRRTYGEVKREAKLRPVAPVAPLVRAFA